MQVAIIDSGCANASSVAFAVERAGANPVLSDDGDVVRSADRVILPGVGTSRAMMQRLRARGLDQLIPSLKQPVLGICLGMQVLFKFSEEDDQTCLGILDGRARAIPASGGLRLPHMGWNTLDQINDDPLLQGVEVESHVYFVHSFYVEPGPYMVAQTNYGVPITAVARKGNFVGCQFHPERSANIGARIIENFLGAPC